MKAKKKVIGVVSLLALIAGASYAAAQEGVEGVTGPTGLPPGCCSIGNVKAVGLVPPPPAKSRIVKLTCDHYVGTWDGSPRDFKIAPGLNANDTYGILGEGISDGNKVSYCLTNPNSPPVKPIKGNKDGQVISAQILGKPGVAGATGATGAYW